MSSVQSQSPHGERLSDSISHDTLAWLLAQSSGTEAATQDRLKQFVHFALQSPVEALAVDCETSELAFCLEIIAVNVVDLKAKVLKITPLLSMAWVYDALRTDEHDTPDSSHLRVLRTYTDTVARQTMGAGLYLEHLVFAAEHAGIDLGSVRRALWGRFVDAVSSGDRGLFPIPEGPVSFGIQKAIVRKRCNGSKIHFGDTRLSDMVVDSKTVTNKQVFNMESEGLCAIVDNLNLMAGADTRKAIVACVNTLNKHHPSTLDLSDAEFSTMREKTTAFLATVDTWEKAVDATDGGKALCGETRDCQTRIQRLQVLTETTRLQARTCQKEIKDFKKRSLERSTTADRKGIPMSFSNRIRSWF